MAAISSEFTGGSKHPKFSSADKSSTRKEPLGQVRMCPVVLVVVRLTPSPKRVDILDTSTGSQPEGLTESSRGSKRSADPRN